VSQKIEFEIKKELDFKINEAYKRVRTNITFSGEDVHAIAVTSSVPNEGKSAVSFNLARSFAEDGRKTLFIDVDIRKSVTVARYGVNKETCGLSHYLSGQIRELDEIVYETDIPNMYIIFTGPKAPNPAELLGLQKFQRMIGKLKEEFDYIIIDCPPLGSVIDAVLVSKASDGTILVVEADNLSHKVVMNVKRQLDQNGCKILGAILNKVEMGGKGYYGYYKGYYGYYDDYGYGYGEDSKSKGSGHDRKKSRHTRTFDTSKTSTSRTSASGASRPGTSALRSPSGTARPTQNPDRSSGNE